MAPSAVKNNYSHIVSAFMSFKDDCDYPKDYAFSDEQLLTITPADLKRWMVWKAFGTATVGAGDLPTKCRSNSLAYYKKAISSKMPLRNILWDPILKRGNPTKSIAVNDFIKSIKKNEVRRQGAPSQARRAIEKDEFENVLAKLNTFADFKRRYLIPTVCKFQFALIARIDDTCNFKEVDLKPNPQFRRFSLLSRISWSKNIREERDAPDQILLGAMDTRYCILLSLGIYLELWCELGLGLTYPYLFGTGNPENTKKLIANILKKDIWGETGTEIRTSANGLLGTHSLRKFPSTFARRNGCSKDDIDARGRWRKCRTVDRYIDVNVPYPDAKVASILAIGGPIKYTLKKGTGLTDLWLQENVVCNMLKSDFLNPEVALVLSLPVLWASFEAAMESYIPAKLRTRIREAYKLVCQLPEDENPVHRIPIIVTGHDDQVHIDDLFENEDNSNTAANGETEEHVGNGALIPSFANRGSNENQFRALYSQINAARREIQQTSDENKESMKHGFEKILQQIEIMKRSINRIAMYPSQRQRQNDLQVEGGHTTALQGSQHAAGPIAQHSKNATLAPNLRNLFVLWNEYEFGIAGRKPAKEFTRAERGGRIKHTYSKRKVVWDKIAELVRVGYTSHVAIDMIYHTYGNNTSLSNIIHRMLCDRKTGGHPNLRV